MELESQRRLRRVSAAANALGFFEPFELDPSIPAAPTHLISLQCEPSTLGTDADEGVLENEIRTTLRGISLERDEVDLYNKLFKSRTHVDASPASDLSLPPGYLLPSTSSARAESLDKESELLEFEVESLKARLKAMKLATNDIIKTKSRLQDSINGIDEEISQHLSQTDETSITAATDIAGCMSSSLQLIKALATMKICDQYDSSDDYASSEPGLTNSLRKSSEVVERIQSARMGIIDQYKRATSEIQRMQRSLPTSADLAYSTSILEALSNEDWDQIVSTAEEAEFTEELEKITIALSRDYLDDLDYNSISQGVGVDDSRHNHLRVKSELEAALALDRIAILEAQEDVLDVSIRSFKEILLPPLQAIHDHLSSLHSRTIDTEALLGALGEEFEDVVDSLELSQVQVPSVEPRDSADDRVVSTLKQLLKTHEGERPSTFPSLVLFDDEDVKNEIQLWTKHATDLERDEESALSNLPLALEDLSNSHAPLLSTVYEHSPLNTSPPFSQSPETAQVVAETQTKVDSLGETLIKLQKDIELLESKQARAKLLAFVSKWTPKA